MIFFNKIKAAFQISGIRKFPEKSLETIRKFQKFCIPTTFIHTWGNDEFLKEYGYSNVKFDLNEKTNSILSEYPNCTYKIESVKNLKPHFDDMFKQIKDPNWRKNSSHFSMFYSIYKSNSLRQEYERKTNTKFDCVFRMRFDSDLKTTFNPRNTNLNKLNVPYDYQYAFNEPDSKKQMGINDQFAWGPPNLIKYYCNVFNKIIDICNTGTIFCPHSILAKHLMNGNIPVDRPKVVIDINGC